MSWFDQARELSSADVASRLGIEVKRGPSSSHCACPACGAERRHRKSRDRRGAVGIPHKTGGWHCFECEESGDAIDFVAWRLGDRRFRDLDSDGRKQVQDWFCSSGGCYDAPPQPWHAVSRREKPLPAAFENAEVCYPPLGDVEALWGSCVPVRESDAATSYLALRGIAGPVADHLHEIGVARALPDGVELPAWAQFGGRPWTETRHNLIFPLYDHNGVMRAVLARSTEASPLRKSVAAHGYGRRGLLLAGSYGQLVLRLGASGHFHARRPLEVSVFEGEIDFLRAVAAGAEEPDSGPRSYEQIRACFGIFSGSWTRDVAERIPGGSVVVCKTDDDEQGDKYAGSIMKSLGQRVKHERVRIADDRPAE